MVPAVTGRGPLTECPGRVDVDHDIGPESLSDHRSESRLERVDPDLHPLATDVLEDQRPPASTTDSPGPTARAKGTRTTEAGETAHTAERPLITETHGPNLSEVDDPPTTEEPDSYPTRSRRHRGPESDPDGPDEPGEGKGAEETTDHAPRHGMAEGPDEEHGDEKDDGQ